jgi:murein DD-endopeptidase MepM/ murein hydrolase activator NlpD
LKSNFFFGNRVRSTFSILLLGLFGLLLYVNLANYHKNLQVPVLNAKVYSWDKKSFWFSPWGRSGIHKGIDIFAPHRTKVISPVQGIVIGTGYGENGGNYIYILGPTLRVYYYAHLNSISVKRFQMVKANAQIGEVGNTGNASLKPYHLHFSVSSLLPIFSRYKPSVVQGWEQMFYLDPNDLLVYSEK